MVFPLGLPLCPLFASFYSIADIPLSPDSVEKVALALRVKH
ncbi:hypothetical protein B932_2604 [Gluconobacter oxydans H24]|nr:hypothetical protein B932_2604 [Gluconobacter oxydans H24]